MRTTLCVFWLVIGYVSAIGQSIELAVQKGHSAEITFVVFNTNGRLLASSGEDHTVKLWHVPTGKEMASFVSGSLQSVNSMVFSDGDDRLYIRYADGSWDVWDIAASKRIEPRPSASPAQFTVQKIFLSPDSVHAFEVEGFYLRKKVRKTGAVVFSRVPVDISQNFSSLTVNEELKLVVGACKDGKLYVYDSWKGKALATLEDHLAPVNSVCFSPNGKVFASASSDRSIIIWDSHTLKPVKRLFSRSFRFESLAFDHSGSLLAVGDELGNGRIIDLKSSRIKITTYPWHTQRVSDLKFSPDGQTVFSTGYDNRLVAFDVQKERTRETVKYKNYWSLGDAMLKAMGAHREPYAWLNTVDISPSGQWIASGGSWREAEIRKQPQRILLGTNGDLDQRKIKAHQGGIGNIAFISDYLFVTGFNRTLIQWHPVPGSNALYFRENQLEPGDEIGGIVPMGKDTVLVSTGRSLKWFSLKSERIFRVDPQETEITALDADAGTGRVAYALLNDLVILDGQKNFQQGKVIRAAHTDKITALAFCPTRALLATASWDATVKLWNTDTGELIATIVAVGKEDHIIITPDNYYFGTKNSLRGIGFKYGKQFISPEQFDLRFNRPDIVVEKLGYAGPNVLKSYRRAYQKRLQKMNFTERMLGAEIHLPELSVVSKNVPLHTAESTLTFKVEATDSKYAVDRINVFVNHIPIFGLGGLDVRDRRLQSIHESISVNLSSGKNRIQFSCLNEKGVESLLETFEITCSAVRKKPNLYLAVVSVSSYLNPDRNLKYAVKDGRDLVNLYSRKADLFDKIIVDTLFDHRATKEKILDLKQRLNGSSVDDQVVVYVSGHGLLDDNLDFYFGTHDLNFEDPSSRGLKYDDLESLLDGIPAREKLLLMDACHSGEVDKGQILSSDNQSLTLGKNQKGTLKRYTYAPEEYDEARQLGMKTSFELMQELFSNLSKGSGAVVISAAAGDSYALESDEWQNGIFTYSILAGLKSGKADQNGDGNITVTELKAFVGREVERLTAGEQKPTSRRENLEFDFVIWR